MALAAVFALMPAQGLLAAQPTGAEAVSLKDAVPEIVAEVNGTALSRDHLAAVALAFSAQQAMSALVAQELVRQEAVRVGVAVTDSEISDYTRSRVQEKLDAMAREVGDKDFAAFEERAREMPDAIAELRRQAENSIRPFVPAELLLHKLLRREVEVDDDEVRRAFDRDHGPAAEVLQIVSNSRSESESVRRQLLAGADFEALARKVSRDPVSALKGGRMPSLSKDSALGAAAFRLEPGQISEVVQTPDGFHVLKLVKLLPATGKRFDDVRAELRTALIEKRVMARRQAYIEELRRKAKIKQFY